MAFMCGCCTDDQGQAVEAVGSAIDQLNDKPKVSTPAEPEEAKYGEPIGASPRNDREFEVVIEKSPGDPRIGLDISVVGGKVLKVWKVKEGLVNEWNKRQPEEMQVKSGDAVVAVNGKRGSADQLLEQVAKGMKVTILCSRGMFA
ncbi:unnamed protein product [Durusdinium trenchii]|uniref:PDZ domain-containing protein n=2 Tax=Durusdinium trenchii TaxID=1381693 RepID=A0ABP0Q2P7_9DINO